MTTDLKDIRLKVPAPFHAEIVRAATAWAEANGHAPGNAIALWVKHVVAKELRNG